MAIYNFNIESSLPQEYAGEIIEIEANSLEEAEIEAEKYCEKVATMLMESISTWYHLHDVIDEEE